MGNQWENNFLWDFLRDFLCENKIQWESLWDIIVLWDFQWEISMGHMYVKVIPYRKPMGLQCPVGLSKGQAKGTVLSDNDVP